MTNDDTESLPSKYDWDSAKKLCLCHRKLESLVRTCCLALNHVLLCQMAEGKDAAVYDLCWLVCWQLAPVQVCAL